MNSKNWNKTLSFKLIVNVMILFFWLSGSALASNAFEQQVGTDGFHGVGIIQHGDDSQKDTQDDCCPIAPDTEKRRFKVALKQRYLKTIIQFDSAVSNFSLLIEYLVRNPLTDSNEHYNSFQSPFQNSLFAQKTSLLFYH